MKACALFNAREQTMTNHNHDFYISSRNRFAPYEPRRKWWLFGRQSLHTLYLQKAAMRAIAHPFFVRLNIQESGLVAEVLQKVIRVAFSA
jgi:hypothetical protein